MRYLYRRILCFSVNESLQFYQGCCVPRCVPSIYEPQVKRKRRWEINFNPRAEDFSSNGTISGGTSYTDPLANTDNCNRDIPLLTQLQTNTIRVYAVDPTKNHDDCMEALQNAGIYVILDLGEPKVSINRDTPEWSQTVYSRYTAVVDTFAKYTNTLGFFAGNEVSNAPNNTEASAFVKAAVRDMKAYIKQKKYRPMGVGYATNDDETRTNLANYFDCGSPSDAIDFWGYNIYSWCGHSSYRESHYEERTEEFSSYNVPAFFAEYGCNVVDKVITPRTFEEVGTLYGKDMSKVWSGGIIYMYFQEANQFGEFGRSPELMISHLTRRRSCIHWR